MQIKKTYRGINPEMLYDEVHDLVQKQGIVLSKARTQTYGLPSGATQSRIVVVFKTQAQRQEEQIKCGDGNIIDSPNGETKMLLDLDEKLLSREKISSIQESLDFILGSYEPKW